ncbi:MAG: uracil-DNA glycosylase [Rhodoferax sp.]|nr:uracil-DNA glycosylase [Rhodoferax sp.]
MSLNLDDRQRAMLQEMGVRVWQHPQGGGVSARQAAAMPDQAADFAIEKEAARAMNTGAAAQKAHEIRKPNPVAASTMASGIGVAAMATTAASAGLAEGIATMAWPALAQTLATCQACSLHVGCRSPVTAGSEHDALPKADWLVVGEPPDEAEARLGTPFAEQVGQLLDNMLKAVGVSRWGPGNSGATAAYLTNVVKCRPAVVRNPQPQELAVCENYLRREVALVQPKVILVLGRFAAQSLLRERVPEVSAIPLGKLRGQIYRYQGIPVVVSYHPAYLLRSQGDKARAWADLCLALSLLKPVAA